MQVEDEVKIAGITSPAFLNSEACFFGLKGAAQTFHRLMNSAFLHLKFVFVNLDDILLASLSANERLVHHKHIFERLEDHSEEPVWTARD